MMYMHGIKFGTTGQSWDLLTGIEELFCIKRLLQGVELLQLGGGKLQAHLIDLLESDAMFTGNRPPTSIQSSRIRVPSSKARRC